MGVEDLLLQVLGTLTELERAVFNARAEQLTRTIISEMLGISVPAVRRAQERAEHKIGKAFLPLAYEGVLTGASSSDLAMPVQQSSQFKGVHWHKRQQKWIATVYPRFHVGGFDCEKEAARAYDEAAIRLKGPDAETNVSLGLLPVESF